MEEALPDFLVSAEPSNLSKRQEQKGERAMQKLKQALKEGLGKHSAEALDAVDKARDAAKAGLKHAEDGVDKAHDQAKAGINKGMSNDARGSSHCFVNALHAVHRP